MPWAKGQSGNPAGGKRREQTFATVLREQLALERAGVTNRQRIAAVLVEKAIRGDLETVKWIVERVDGKVPDRLEADIDATTTHALDDSTRLAILAFAARRRALERGA